MAINKHLSCIIKVIILSLRDFVILGFCTSVFLIFDINAFHGIALVLASSKGPPAIVKTALYLGADVHAENDLALFAAVRDERPENVKVLLDHGAGTGHEGDGILSAALSHKNLDIANILLDHGVGTEEYGPAFLSATLSADHVDMAKVLVKRFNIKLKCRWPWTKYLSKGWSPESVQFINEQLKDVPYDCPHPKESK